MQPILSSDASDLGKNMSLLAKARYCLDQFYELQIEEKAAFYRNDNQILSPDLALLYTESDELELINYWYHLVVTSGKIQDPIPMIEANGAPKGNFNWTPQLITYLIKEDGSGYTEDKAWEVASKIIANKIAPGDELAWIRIFKSIISVKDFESYKIDNVGFLIKLLSENIETTPIRAKEELRKKTTFIDVENFVERFLYIPCTITLESGEKISLDSNKAKEILTAYNKLIAAEELISLEEALGEDKDTKVSSRESLIAIEFIGKIWDEFGKNQDIRMREMLAVLSRYGRLGR